MSAIVYLDLAGYAWGAWGFVMSEEIKRRPLLKAIGAGIGGGAALSLLPKSWTRPVVHSVIVPAHAAASPAVTTTTTKAPTTSGAPSGTTPQPV